MFSKELSELKLIASNMKKQGKTDQQIKQTISVYLKEHKIK